MKIAHIGIAVKSLKDAVPVFEKIFGVKAADNEFVENQKVNVRKIHLENCDIELLEGTSTDSPVTKFIEKKGEGIHHIAFDVDNIEEEMKRLKAEGFVLLNEVPKQGADNKLVCFLHPKGTNGVLIELCQEKPTT